MHKRQLEVTNNCKKFEQIVDGVQGAAERSSKTNKQIWLEAVLVF